MNGREEHNEKHRSEPGFVDIESRDSMDKRADVFLDQHLLPLLGNGGELFVAVVSHGMLLSSLWKRLLFRLPKRSLTVAPEVTAARGAIVLEHLGGWSNTGYLELILCIAVPASLEDAQLGKHEFSDSSSPSYDTAASIPVDPTNASGSLDAGPPKDVFAPITTKTTSHTLQGWSTTIVAVDSKQHLVGLKRQRGGIGRLAHDEGQKKLDGFFKRQRTG